MSTILEELFYGQYNMNELKMSPEHRQAARKQEPYWEKIQASLGQDFTDAFLGTIADEQNARGKQLFREGFLLGGRLMLELLAPTDTASL